jgi:hypothetical protein
MAKDLVKMSKNQLPPPKTPEEVKKQLLSGYHEVLSRAGVHEEELAKRLKAELNATRKKVVLWDIRQRARMDAQKLLGLYPAEKHDHEINMGVTMDLSDEDRKLLKSGLDGVAQAIIKQAHTEED